MLDLMTLGLSMGAQEDLEKMREETGVTTVHTEEPTGETPAAVNAVASVLDSIESAASSAVCYLMPTTSIADQIVAVAQAPTVDLSLPTAAKKS